MFPCSYLANKNLWKIRRSNRSTGAYRTVSLLFLYDRSGMDNENSFVIVPGVLPVTRSSSSASRPPLQTSPLNISYFWLAQSRVGPKVQMFATRNCPMGWSETTYLYFYELQCCEESRKVLIYSIEFQFYLTLMNDARANAAVFKIKNYCISRTSRWILRPCIRMCRFGRRRARELNFFTLLTPFTLKWVVKQLGDVIVVIPYR